MLGCDLVRYPRVEALRGLFELVDDPAVAAGQLDRPTHDGRQHGLEVECGADGLADLSQGLELLDRTCQLSGSSLELLQQSHVFDRDDGLVCEGRHQVDLLVGEGADLRAPYEDGTDEHALPKHRDAQAGPETADPLMLGQLILRIGQDIEDVNRLAHDGYSPHHRSTPRANVIVLQELSELRGGAVDCSRAHGLAVKSKNGSERRVAEFRRVLDEDFEHRLEIERRATDHLEHFARGGLLL